MGPEVWLLLTLMISGDKPDVHYREKMSIEQCWKAAREWVDAPVTDHEKELGGIGHSGMCARVGNMEEKS